MNQNASAPKKDFTLKTVCLKSDSVDPDCNSGYSQVVPSISKDFLPSPPLAPPHLQYCHFTGEEKQLSLANYAKFSSRFSATLGDNIEEAGTASPRAVSHCLVN